MTDHGWRSLERVLVGEAAGSLAFAGLNCAYFCAGARSESSAARRTGALALLLVNLALAAESALYLAVLPDMGARLESFGALAVRTIVLGASLTISALIFRRESARRGPR
jgi:hypothetical protein